MNSFQASIKTILDHESYHSSSTSSLKLSRTRNSRKRNLPGRDISNDEKMLVAVSLDGDESPPEIKTLSEYHNMFNYYRMELDGHKEYIKQKYSNKSDLWTLRNVGVLLSIFMFALLSVEFLKQAGKSIAKRQLYFFKASAGYKTSNNKNILGLSVTTENEQSKFGSPKSNKEKASLA